MLALVARRILNHRREAEKRGEEYHDIAPLTMTTCGMRVKLSFVPESHGYEPHVEIVNDPRFTQEEFLQAASEIMGRSAQALEPYGNRLYFRRSDT